MVDASMVLLKEKLFHGKRGICWPGDKKMMIDTILRELLFFTFYSLS